MSTIFFEFFFSLSPHRQKTPELWKDICCYSSQTPSSYFQRAKTLWYSKTSVFVSERPVGWKKGKEVTFSNFCHALVALSALWPVCTREQEKSPLEEGSKSTRGGGRLNFWASCIWLKYNSLSVEKNEFTYSLWVLAAAQRKVQGDCSVPLYILHLASSKSLGWRGSNLHQFLAAMHICLERYAHSLSLWFLHEVRAA